MSLPGNLKGGARLAGTVSTYYRIQNPIALLDADGEGATRLVGRLATPLAQRYFRARDRRASTRRANLPVQRHTDVPAEALGSLYERTVPDALHTVRNEAFYRWRFENPAWNYTAYTATRGETVVSSVIAGTRHHDGMTETRLTDALPMGGGVRDGALAGLLGAVVADHRDSDVISAFGDGVPHELLRRHGFLSDHGPALSLVSTTTPMVVSLLSGGRATWQVNGFDAADRANWLLSYCDWDTS